MAYSKQVVERFESVLKNPEKHSVGRFDPTDPNVASGMVGAPACGDVMKLDIKLNGDTIEDVKFKLSRVSSFTGHIFHTISLSHFCFQKYQHKYFYLNN